MSILTPILSVLTNQLKKNIIFISLAGVFLSCLFLSSLIFAATHSMSRSDVPAVHASPAPARVHSGYLVAISNVSATPQFFDPRLATLQIGHMLDHDARVTVKVLSPDGNTVFQVLKDNERLSGATHTVIWDGKNALGEVPVSDGDYRVRVQAVDLNGQMITRDGNIRVVL